MNPVIHVVSFRGFYSLTWYSKFIKQLFFRKEWIFILHRSIITIYQDSNKHNLMLCIQKLFNLLNILDNSFSSYFLALCWGSYNCSWSFKPLCLMSIDITFPNVMFVGSKHNSSKTCMSVEDRYNSSQICMFVRNKYNFSQISMFINFSLMLCTSLVLTFVFVLVMNTTWFNECFRKF